MITQPTGESEAPLASQADLYLQLATAAGLEDQRSAAARFLLLAASCAQQAGLEDVADGCRRQILVQHPDHALHRFKTFANALEHPEFATYVRELSEAYPPPKAEYLLERYRSAGFHGEHPWSEALCRYRWPSKKQRSVPPRASSSRRARTRLTEMPRPFSIPMDEVPSPIPTFEPIPFEWPTASARSVGLFGRISTPWALVIGLLAGMSIGIWVGPRLGPWLEFIRHRAEELLR